MDIVEYGLYTIRDKFFTDYKSVFWTDNKSENRPHYCSFIDKGIIWFIPLSTQVEAYRKKMEADEAIHNSCIFYHIGKVNGIDRVFLIGNMFPVTPEYIKKPYTINSIPYVVGNEKLIKQIYKKATKYLALVKHGKLKPHIDIIELSSKLSNSKS